MRKRVFGYQLGRTKNQRRALFRGLVTSLIKEGEITTTEAKAKAVKPTVEKLVTKAKKGTIADRRVIFRFLGKKALTNRLVEEIAPLFKGRKGGYLRLVHLGRRRGDNAPMMKVLFTERVEKLVPAAKKAAKKEAPTSPGPKKIVKKAPVKKTATKTSKTQKTTKKGEKKS